MSQPSVWVVFYRDDRKNMFAKKKKEKKILRRSHYIAGDYVKSTLDWNYVQNKL